MLRFAGGYPRLWRGRHFLEEEACTARLSARPAPAANCEGNLREAKLKRRLRPGKQDASPMSRTAARLEGNYMAIANHGGLPEPLRGFLAASAKLPRPRRLILLDGAKLYGGMIAKEPGPMQQGFFSRFCRERILCGDAWKEGALAPMKEAPPEPGDSVAGISSHGSLPGTGDAAARIVGAGAGEYG